MALQMFWDSGPRPLDLILSAVGATEELLIQQLLSLTLPPGLDPVYLES